MALLGARIALFGLSALAVLTLHGYFYADGNLQAMQKHAHEGVFSNGKTLHHVYSGYHVVDKLLAMSVSFWDPVCHESRVAKLLSTTLSATLQSLGVFAMVESLRNGNRSIMLRWAPVQVFAWQYIGAAIFVPIYFVVELESHFTDKATDPAVPYLQAKSLLPASILTVMHLFRMVYFPPGNITSSQHQAFLAVWQLAPLFCYCALSAIANYLSSGKGDTVTRARNADVPWVKATYAVFGLFSALVHLGVQWTLATSADPGVSHSAAYVPRLDKLWQADAAARVYIEETTFFLQWDYVIIVAASAVYAVAILEGVYGRFAVGARAALFLATCATCHVGSAGLVYAAVLSVREDHLRGQFAKKQEKAR
ncbi:hypothetical protein GGS23DRAFT_613041 [Durotheca rogersii]|uniref:uncharacterized protein n=1 Tax=Durotheca rogersii TaxID=419775 RepID=UPI0022211546|nr:uncharacterized protein GGS23DRAFT_613041 [Durotheca rogersii]KAI5867876.1 hypothetical protein GGS23DRAFT_613041 [Durotheca rogersii]